MSQAQIKAVSDFNPARFTFSRKITSLQRESHVTDSTLLQINFVILVVSGVGSTKVNSRPALLGASSMSNAAKRIIL